MTMVTHQKQSRDPDVNNKKVNTIFNLFQTVFGDSPELQENANEEINENIKQYINKQKSG